MHHSTLVHEEDVCNGHLDHDFRQGSCHAREDIDQNDVDSFLHLGAPDTDSEDNEDSHQI
jgi:hypothetical protein